MIINAKLTIFLVFALANCQLNAMFARSILRTSTYSRHNLKRCYTNKVYWLTDIHIDKLTKYKRQELYRIIDPLSDRILITGDIAEGDSVCELLTEMHGALKIPIDFVLGNHDYYHQNIDTVRNDIISLCDNNKQLTWLGQGEIVEYGDRILLVGQDGWADARYGDFSLSPFLMTDSYAIHDLRKAKEEGALALKIKMQELADADATKLKFTLSNAIRRNPQKIIIATHVPPFAECAWSRRGPSSDKFLPFFTSRVMGDLICDFGQEYPEISFVVLAGHTHVEKQIKIMPNIEVIIGGAAYLNPSLSNALLSFM